MSEFSPVAYGALLAAFLDRGYEVRGYHDAEPWQRHLIVRHDVDMSLEAALTIAEIEKSLGIVARYFVLLRTEMYNVFSARGNAAVRALADLGHEVGLHLDASLYANDVQQLQQAAEVECGVLETATGKAVRSISFHRPAKSLLGYPQTVAGRIHAYQPRYFIEMGYCSDSRGAWFHGEPLNHPALREGRAVQLLTHPLWWTGAGASPEAKVLDFISARITGLDAAVEENCSVHKAGRWRDLLQVGD